MGYEQQYEELLILRPQIDEKLKDLDFEKMKELMLWLAQSKSYQKLKIKENQLIMLEAFCQIWVEEKRKLEEIGISDDVFYGVDSLESLERKYLTAQFGILRLEMAMPAEYCEQAVDAMIDYRFSGIALYTILMRETSKQKEHIVKLAKAMKQKGQMVTALFLLQKGNEAYPGEENILLELADCWLEGQQWRQAYECLNKIPEPLAEVRELKKMLEKVLNHEEL